ncbi:hypothetical protein IFVP22_C1230008 [Vibrio parahaemolyticus]
MSPIEAINANVLAPKPKPIEIHMASDLDFDMAVCATKINEGPGVIAPMSNSVAIGSRNKYCSNIYNHPCTNLRN